MEYKKVTNESGLSLEIVYTKEHSEDYDVILGGDKSNPTWDKYFEQYKDEWKEHIILVRRFIEENNLIGTKGQAQDNWLFKFSDGQLWGFTWRGWGDLMQAIVNKNEGYMAYYM